MTTELKDAVKILCEALKEDKAEGSYYYAWQAGVAMAFKDEWHRYFEKFTKESNPNYLHEISNNAAKNFLDTLITLK